MPRAGEEIPGIPDTRELMHTILTRARDDSAVRLELGPDHGEALVGVRLDAESGVDRLAVLGDLERYLGSDHRSALLRVDVSDPNITPSIRTLGRGILAADDQERVLRICARSGRNLNLPESQAVERAARRAALMPTVDPAKLKGEVSQEVNDFLEEVAIAEAHVGLPRPSERQRLAGELAAQPVDATVADVLTSLRGVWGERLSASALGAQATELAASDRGGQAASHRADQFQRYSVWRRFADRRGAVRGDSSGHDGSHGSARRYSGASKCSGRAACRRGGHRRDCL